jgi:hypothetical protein
MALITPPPTDTTGALMELALPVAETCVAVAPVKPLVAVTGVVCEPVLVDATSYHEVGHEYVVGHENVVGHEYEAAIEALLLSVNSLA